MHVHDVRWFDRAASNWESTSTKQVIFKPKNWQFYKLIFTITGSLLCWWWFIWCDQVLPSRPAVNTVTSHSHCDSTCRRHSALIWWYSYYYKQTHAKNQTTGFVNNVNSAVLQSTQRLTNTALSTWLAADILGSSDRDLWGLIILCPKHKANLRIKPFRTQTS